MNLPSIKLNIFKKLEYYLVLRKLNKQFIAHLNIAKKKQDDNITEIAYPTWEIEKKILFWTYAGHKHLRSPLTMTRFVNSDALKEKFLSQEEVNRGINYNDDGDTINRVFFLENLVQRSFAEEVRNGSKSYVVTKEGLAMGELLWSLYNPVKNDDFKKEYSRIYQELYSSSFVLKEAFLPNIFFMMQLISFYFFTFIAVFVLCYEIIYRLSLSSYLNNFLVNYSKFINYFYDFMFYVVIISFAIFILSFIGDIIYNLFIDLKYNKIEDLKNSE